MDARLRRTYRAVEQKLRDIATVPLDTLLGRCAEPGPAYPAEAAAFEDDPPLRRMLGRIGLLTRTRSAANLYELLQAMAKATGERAAVVRRVLDLYCAPADGVPLVVCGDDPQCDDCPLAPDCKHFHRTPTIPDLPEDQRPRERLIAEGPEALSDAELLAIILRTGTPEDTAIGLAHKLLARFANFRTLATTTVAELSVIKGIGPAKAAQIQAALEIGQRAAKERAAEPGRALTDSHTVASMYAPRFRDVKIETFLVLLLDAKHRVFREIDASKGSLTASIVHPREVFTEAVRHSAAAILCIHNHPSGDPTPSLHDVEVTRRLVETGKVIGIHLIDHVILGDGAHYSFADHDQIPEDRRDDG